MKINEIITEAGPIYKIARGIAGFGTAMARVLSPQMHEKLVRVLAQADQLEKMHAELPAAQQQAIDKMAADAKLQRVSDVIASKLKRINSKTVDVDALYNEVNKVYPNQQDAVTAMLAVRQSLQQQGITVGHTQARPAQHPTAPAAATQTWDQYLQGRPTA
jgi:hypothetical protein